MMSSLGPIGGAAIGAFGGGGSSSFMPLGDDFPTFTDNYKPKFDGSGLF